MRATKKPVKDCEKPANAVPVLHTSTPAISTSGRRTPGCSSRFSMTNSPDGPSTRRIAPGAMVSFRWLEARPPATRFTVTEAPGPSSGQEESE